MKRASKGGKVAGKGQPTAFPPCRDDEPAERREAMFAAVDEVVDAMGDWLHEDMTHLDRPTHNYGRGEHLARQLVTLVSLLIEADRATGSAGTGDEKEFSLGRS